MKKLKVIDNEYGFYNYEGIPVISSRTVHKVFDKEHFHVLRDIRELIERVEQSDERTGALGTSKFGVTYFYQSTYVDEWNREKPEYLLTKDGFTLLAMEYTSKKAMDFKLAYMRKYNEMDQYIKNLNSCRVGYPDLTFAIKASNKSPKPYHFSNEADLINRTVLGVSAKQFKEMNSLDSSINSIRPHLSPEQLRKIDILQRVCVGLIVSDPTNYKKRKQKLEGYLAKIDEAIKNGTLSLTN